MGQPLSLSGSTALAPLTFLSTSWHIPGPQWVCHLPVGSFYCRFCVGTLLLTSYFSFRRISRLSGPRAGALVKTAAARPEWAASRHDHIFVSSGEVQMWETATQVGLAGGDRVFVEVKGGSKSGSNGLWGWEENEEVVKGILARNWVASEAQVLFALLRGHLPSTADPVPQGTSRHAVECAEMLLLRERCVLHKTSPVLLPPFCAAAQEIPRQFEYSPHTPGLMAVGSFNGKVGPPSISSAVHRRYTASV